MTRGRERVTLAILLDREVDELDLLLSEVRGGIRGPAHFDALEEKASGIADRLRGAFRSC